MNKTKGEDQNLNIKDNSRMRKFQSGPITRFENPSSNHFTLKQNNKNLLNYINQYNFS